ncbi:MAG: cobyric acid synthase [Desulfovibrionaceae bacterium]
MKSSLCGSPDPADESRFAHGGHLRALAERAGCRPSELLDFSASMCPIGPPAWLPQELAAAAEDAAHYPDPDAADLCLAACELYKVWPNQVMAGNGASELLWAATLAGVRFEGARRAVIPVPSYVDYERLAETAGLECVFAPLDPAGDFRLDGAAVAALAAHLDQPALVYLCQPNNPTGAGLDAGAVCRLAADHPHCRFLVDESFADFAPGLDRLARARPDNVTVILSLTKFYAIPGLRLGLAFAAPETVHQMKKLLPAWSVNAAAQRVGARALRDLGYQAAARARTRELREELAAALGWLPGLRVFPSEANFLLCRTDRLGDSARPLAERLLASRIAIRRCDNFRGLDETYFRVAVRTAEENRRLVEAMETFYGVRKAPVVLKKPKKPALMLQGTSSNAGKSVLAAALCRILLQDGHSVAPFKAQNMSNNSFVTRRGEEMGRAQVTQAMACRLEPDVRMNPVLLKPGSDTGSQVVLLGRPVGNMNVREYVGFKPRAFEKVRQAYDSLAAEHEVMVIEGAGSPAEINLKHHDIVNMAMAEYADARVVLVGDIDRGGVFASLVGTMELLEKAERERVCGFVLNRFRGDASLLDPAISATYGYTGKPVLGTVPYIHNLGLPEEDSVSFKAGLLPGMDRDDAGPGARVDIAVIDLGHISNFNDLDALAVEPDVSLRVVASPHDLGEPDAVILPGSKNTVADMKALKGQGMAAALRGLPEKTRIVGICGGFQMLGAEIDDPLGLETSLGRVDGFGLLPLRTTMAAEKTLARSTGTHLASGEAVSGYEIHHGVTTPLSEEALPAITTQGGAPLGFGLASGRIWGTYLHGLFDEDGFRRWFIDDLRTARGWPALAAPQASYSIESALDHLASVVRGSLDMPAIYRALGFGSTTQASLL